MAACAVIASSAAYSRQGSVPPAGGKKTHPVDFWGDVAQSTTTPNGKIDVLQGNAKIVSEDTTMTSDKATYNESSGVANSPGHIRIKDPQNTIDGNSGIAYYKRHDAVISGNVHIQVSPKPSDANAPEGSAKREFKDPIYIDCDQANYDWRGRVAITTGHLILKMKDRTTTADKATYYGKDEKVVLEGHVHETRPNGEHMDSDEATAILTEGAEVFTAKGVQTGTGLHGTVLVEEDDDTSPPAGGAKPGGPATAPAKPGVPTPATPGPNTPATPTTPAPTTPTTPAPTTPAAPPNPAPSPTKTTPTGAG